jgi:hypothetical protein
MTASTGKRRGVAWFLLGLVTLQAAWILLLPPFAAIDEIDHAVRAAGVAGGEWRLAEVAEDGRGELTTVPASLVDAASAQCANLTYVGPDNCRAVRNAQDGDVVVATAAGTYHPAFYFVVGTAAEPFDGAAALYAMRAVAAALCAFVVGLAAWLQRRRGPWARAGLVLALTPTLVYTTSLGAPNGLEIAAGILLWVSLLELADREPEEARAPFWCAVGAGSLLLVLRMLGPLFLVLIVVCVAALTGRRAWSAVVHRRGRLVAGVGVLVVAAGAAIHWAVIGGQATSGATPPPASASGATGPGDEPWSPLNVVGWALQAVAVFPYRNQPAPTFVYGVLGALVLTFLVGALRAGSGRRARWSLVLVCALTAAVPLLLTAATYDSLGTIWQGRYGLAIGVGMVLVAGRVLDHSVSWSVPPVVTVSWAALTGVAVAACLLRVRSIELASPAAVNDPLWWNPHPAVLVTVAMVASAAFALSVQAAGRQDDRLDDRVAGPE